MQSKDIIDDSKLKKKDVIDEECFYNLIYKNNNFNSN